MQGRIKFFDQKYLTKLTVWLLVLIVACAVTKSMAFVVLIPIALFYIVEVKSVNLLFIVMVATFCMGFNGIFFPKSMVFAVAQKVLLGLISVFVIIQSMGIKKSAHVIPFLWMIPYLIFMAITSQMGWCPQISNLKLLLFATLYLGMFASAARAIADRPDAMRVRCLYLAISIFIVFGSFVIWPMGGIGYMGAEELSRNPDAPSLYMGTTNHSQSLGVMSALLGVLIFADWAFGVQRKSRFYLALIIGVVILIYISSCRTAMVSFVFGVGLTGLCALRQSRIGARWRRKIVSWLLGLAAVGAVAILAVSPLREKALRFVVKYDSSDRQLTKDDILASRSSKLEGAIYNWRKSPLVGNGFQVSEEMAYTEIASLRDILTAPVEKSTWTYAILEEGGVIGMGLFVFFLLIVTCSLWTRKGYITLSVFGAVVMSNMGEFTIFSMSAGGGMLWAEIAVATVLDAARLRQEYV